MNRYEKQIEALSLKDEKSVLNELSRQYKEAMGNIKEKVAELEKRLGETTDESIRRSITYQLNYQKALQGQIGGILDTLQSDNFNTIQDFLKQSYETGFIGSMYDMQGQGIPLILPIDQNKMIKAILTDSKISGDLYTSLGNNIDELKKEIRREITRGLANNYSYSQIAQLIDIRGDVAKNKAYRIARTEGHRVQQEATYDAQIQAKKEGAEVVKQWVAITDSRTREAHAELDGKIVEVEDEFVHSGHKALYPGGFGVAGLDINCRCRIVQRAKWALDEEELERLKERAKKFDLDKTQDFEDFKKKYLDATKSSNFVESSTIQEAREYTSKFATNVKLDKINNLDSLNAMNETIEDLTTKYPINKLDSITQHKFKTTAAQANFTELDLGIDFMNESHINLYKDPKQRELKLKSWIEQYETKYLGVPGYDQKKVKKAIKEWKEALKFSRNNVIYKGMEIQSVIAHEYGHILADQYLGQICKSYACKEYSSETATMLRKKIRSVFSKAKDNGDIYKISKYASQDEYEFFAESFTMYHMGQEDMPDYISEMIEEVLNYGKARK